FLFPFTLCAIVMDREGCCHRNGKKHRESKGKGVRFEFNPVHKILRVCNGLDFMEFTIRHQVL
ncbi:MAG: hypothetical protein KAH38_00250, partial [Candidatus Hydrogenedentes bacterium]|nr:hypothetical protein [Candidatus Hydrogenedentota bacterium]